MYFVLEPQRGVILVATHAFCIRAPAGRYSCRRMYFVLEPQRGVILKLHFNQFLSICYLIKYAVCHWQPENRMYRMVVREDTNHDADLGSGDYRFESLYAKKPYRLNHLAVYVIFITKPKPKKSEFCSLKEPNNAHRKINNSRLQRKSL